MKVAVIGGRDFTNFGLLVGTLDSLEVTPTLIISGGAQGADRMAYEYACNRGITFRCHPPLEKEKALYGYARAAMRRNLRVIHDAELVVAFPTKKSKGTWAAVRLAEKFDKEVRIISGTLARDIDISGWSV